jgi:hypothetical protein
MHYAEFSMLQKETMTSLGICQWGMLSEIVSYNGGPLVIAIFRIDGSAHFDMSILHHCPAKIAGLITHAIAVHSLQVIYENHLVLHLLSI